jgi:TRAP-type C4-dicarboxylate transport system substrate-binding protein
VQKFCSLTNHIADGFWFMANNKMWQGLPADLQKIVAQHINDAALLERQDIATLNETIVQTLEKTGLVFNTPETGSFREILRKANFYSEWKQKFGEEAWAVLESNTGKLA